MLNRRDFEKIQQKTGFNLDLLEKAYHLTRVLNEMQKIQALSKNLTLKGGTALNFLHLDIPRLSIDIDIDFNYREHHQIDWAEEPLQNEAVLSRV